jgi:hypothetical protein
MILPVDLESLKRFVKTGKITPASLFEEIINDIEDLESYKLRKILIKLTAAIIAMKSVRHLYVNGNSVAPYLKKVIPMSKHKHKKNPLTFKSLEKLIMAQSQWLTTVLAAIQTIASSNVNDTKTQAAVTALTAQLGTDEGNQAATNAEFQTAISTLVKQLAAAPATGTTGTTGATTVTGAPATLSASSGSINGGETITINGTGFTGATAVNFGSVAGTSLSVQNDTTLTVVSPAQGAGTVPVSIVTPSATIAAGNYALS